MKWTVSLKVTLITVARAGHIACRETLLFRISCFYLHLAVVRLRLFFNPLFLSS